jgi:predicted enzyme related to lactoylglutathione lyase
MGNPVTQFQILSKTPEATAEFYSGLFGWKVNDNNAMGYRRIETGSKDGIQGGIWPAPPQSSNFVQLFVTVEDVKLCVRKAEAMGAKTIIPATMLPEGDEMAVLHDPHGLAFAVWKQRK